MTGAVVAIAEAIRWPVAVVALWGCGAAVTAAERCPVGRLGLLRVADACARMARQMLPPQG
jgi:hypothetical protein